MRNKKYPVMTILFLIAAIWNLIGAGFGYFNTDYTFQLLFNRELADPLCHAIYQGAWGTTLTYFIGYLIVAYDPVKHSGVVLVGGIGKIAFALKLIQYYLAGWAQPVILTIVAGDLIFGIFFIYYFYHLYVNKEKII